MNPRTIFVEIAKSQLAVRETSRNQGHGIEKYWMDTNYPNGYQNREPYCAAFVCWVVAEAIRRGFKVGPAPRDASVRNLVAWARRDGNGALVFSPSSSKYTPQPGDLVYWAFGGSTPNHIGIVETVRGKTINTIEANTDSSGGREGDGVYLRSRSVSGAAGYIRLAWKAERF
jgi:cell wall-associated NlpC family hydrolase